MEKVYNGIVKSLLTKHNIKVKAYNKQIHGTAYLHARQIKIPRPTCGISLYVALHEIGHIVALERIAFKAPNWLHEYEATKFGIEEAHKRGIRYTEEEQRAIVGYFRWQLKKSIRSNSIRNISDKAFKLARFSKPYWERQYANNKEPKLLYPEFVGKSFLEWGNMNVYWRDKA